MILELNPQKENFNLRELDLEFTPINALANEVGRVRAERGRAAVGGAPHSKHRSSFPRGLGLQPGAQAPPNS